MTKPSLGSAAGSLPGSSPESFPREYARTQRYTLGAPRHVVPAPDGTRAVFLRSRSGTDRTGCLWCYELDSGTERLLADPDALLAGDAPADLPSEELARRERAREGGAGIVAYSTDAAVRRAAFTLAGRLFVTSVTEVTEASQATDPSSNPIPEPGGAREITSPGPVVDPRLNPAGTHIAYVSGGALHVAGVDDGSSSTLLSPDAPGVTWGLAEFVAAEEMDRARGYWWSPDGTSLLVARVDESPVQRWYLTNPAEPSMAPTEVAYPAAGTSNAGVTLTLVGLDGRADAIVWDSASFPYLAAVHWSRYGPPLLLVQSRDQRHALVLAVEGTTTRVLREITDTCWVDLVSGTPAWTAAGQLLTVEPADDTATLMLDGVATTFPGLQVAGVLAADDAGVLLSASEEPLEMGVWQLDAHGTLSELSQGSGRHSAARRGQLLALSSTTLDQPGTRVVLVSRPDPDRQHKLTSYAVTPSLNPRVELHHAGRRALRTAVLLPTGWDPDAGSLPVLMDPYGGPGAQRVVASHNAFLSAQWLADQGFAVIVTDGRGSPNRGPAWGREIAFDLAGPTLEDQIDALEAVAADRPYLDLSRVGIRGWSFGGYLAALAVIRRPDVFAAAVAGAPVTDWALYDTHYTERYLGTPQEHPEAYARSGLLAEAHRLERPLLLIHGFGDDNVVMAHTLRLSSALVAAGRPHSVLPLTGVTHMTPQEEVAENLLLLQVEFLRSALRRPA